MTAEDTVMTLRRPSPQPKGCSRAPVWRSPAHRADWRVYAANYEGEDRIEKCRLKRRKSWDPETVLPPSHRNRL
jgi:hypothetical protein